MFAREVAALALILVACAHAPPPVTTPTTESAATPPAPSASAPGYCKYEDGHEKLTLRNPTHVETLLHASCRYGHVVDALRSEVAGSCRAPFRNLRDTLRAEDALEESRDCLTPEARDRFAEILEETVATFVDLACVWKATEPASNNPNVGRCPLPDDLWIELATPAERARKARGEVVVPETYRAIPAGILAFVSAWSNVDDVLFARLNQRALLVCDWSVAVEYTPDGRCLVDGQVEEHP